jgi:hypothetical protein
MQQLPPRNAIAGTPSFSWDVQHTAPPVWVHYTPTGDAGNGREHRGSGPEERYAAGEYPTLSEPGQGLPAWTRANRPIRNTDIVLWHTIGIDHMVRAEDWPVMPVLWHSFELRPFDFFNRTPA